MNDAAARTGGTGVAARAGRDVVPVLAPFVVGHAVVLAGLALARALVDRGATTRPPGQRPSLFLFDAAFYRDIAAKGYEGVGRPSLRFFPLYPLATRAVDALAPGGADVAAIAVASVAGLVFLVLLHALTRRECGDGVALRTVWFAALLPGLGLALATGYAEALFCALATATLLGLRAKRWWWAAAAGLLAGLTRPLGPLLAVPAAVEALRGLRDAPGRERVGRVAAVVAPFAGSGIYLLWARAAWGDMFLPLRLQNDPTLRGGWANPVSRVIEAVRDLGAGDQVGSGLHVVAIAVFVLLLLVSIRKLPLSFTLYAAVWLVFAVSAHNLDSIERYGLSTVPFLLALGVVTARPVVERSFLSLAAAALLGTATLAFLGFLVP